MKIGVEISIDVTKIEKARLYQGKKGKYINLTTFIDTEEVDKFDNNGFISHKQTKEEREAKTKTTIVGNCKVFYKEGAQQSYDNNQARKPAPRQNQNNQDGGHDSFDDNLDIPF